MLAVWFSVFIAALLGLLAFAGDAAIGAVFSVCTVNSMNWLGNSNISSKDFSYWAIYCRMFQLRLRFSDELILILPLQYTIPIGARFIFKGHNYKPGPFNLGVLVSSSLTHPLSSPSLKSNFIFIGPTSCNHRHSIHDIHRHRLPVPSRLGTRRSRYELWCAPPSSMHTLILTFLTIAVVVMGGVMIGSLIWYWFPKVNPHSLSISTLRLADSSVI